MQSIPAFYFDQGALADLAERERESFRTARPFQHLVLEDFLPPDVLQLLIREFPGPDDIEWELHGPGRSEWARDRAVDKLACGDETQFGPFTRHFMGQLNSGTFVRFLEDLTGMRGILPDVTYNNCGMHSTGPGGRLMIHTDVNRHPLGNKMHQYLNLLLFLNEDWEEQYGGHLELWNQDRKPVKRILPRANTVALFNTGTRSLHGHPRPLTCPPGRRRNSLAVYYYLRDRPPSEEYAGMQRSVHWVPNLEGDREFAREALARGLARLDKLGGVTIGVGPDVLPFDAPAELVDPASRTLPLTFLRPQDVADPAAFAATHLGAALARHGGNAAAFLGAYRPIALIGAGLGDPRALTCLVDKDGDTYTVLGPDAEELFWVGYLDEILEMVK